jgi:thiol-disulfide isomerase/thioredoxin
MTRAIYRSAAIAIAMSMGLPAATRAADLPAGPKWTNDPKNPLAEAQKAALEQRVPLLIYFTKKECPDCAAVEKNLLPNADLKPVYDKLVWLYVNRGFNMNNPADRAAEKIEVRFGITNYPHLLMIDPETLGLLEDMARTPEPFVKAVQETKVRPNDPSAAMDKLKLAEKRAVQLENNQSKLLARTFLSEQDIVCRVRAVQALGHLEPLEVATQAKDLLGVRNDVLRIEVCKILDVLADPGAPTIYAAAVKAVKPALPILGELAQKPKDSLNPDLMRCAAVHILGKFGGAESIQLLGEIAAKEAKENPEKPLAREAVNALGAIGARLPKEKKKVTEALVEAYPQPPPPNADAATKVRYFSLAEVVHRHLSKINANKIVIKPTMDRYDELQRELLRQQWLK